MLLFRICLAGSLFVVIGFDRSLGSDPASHNRTLPIEQNKRWGYIDSSGRIVIEPQFAGAGKFADGLAPVEVAGKWGYINQEGVLIVKPAVFRGA
jgi:hypothetical protein